MICDMELDEKTRWIRLREELYERVTQGLSSSEKEAYNGGLYESPKIFVDGVRFLMVKQFGKIILELGVERRDVDETVVAKIEVVPIVLAVVCSLCLIVGLAVFFFVFGYLNLHIRFLHLGEEIVRMLVNDFVVDEIQHLIIDLV